MAQTRSISDAPNLPIKVAFVDAASLGSNTVLAAVSGKCIKVLSVALISKLANDVKFLSSATQISATIPLGANGGFVLPLHSYGWFKTAQGEALNINLSVATLTGVVITYIEE